MILGIITITICLVGYCFSWKYYLKQDYNIAVFLLIVFGFILRVYISLDFYLHPWDERYHALVAKNLIGHPLIPTLYDNPILQYDFRSWISNHIWLHKQPLPLWIISLSMKLFGINEIALRIPSIIMTTIGIWLTFFIANYYFNRRTGYLAAFFYSISGIIIEMTSGRIATDHVDIFFLFFIELAIFFSIVFVQKKNTLFNILVAFSIGAAVLSKWLPALIVIPIWYLILIDSKKFQPKAILLQFTVLLSLVILIVSPWQMYIYQTFPNEAKWEGSFNYKHIIQALDNQSGPFYYYFNKIRINYGELIYLPLLGFIFQYIKNFKNTKILSLLIWIIVPLIFFSIAKTKMQGYILFISPALFIITSNFYFILSDLQISNRFIKNMKLILMVLIICLPIRYTIERIKPFDNLTRNPNWVSELKILNKKGVINGVLLNYDRPIEAMFYTNFTVYPIIPNKKVIQELINKKYTVMINDNDALQADIASIKGIVKVKLTSIE